MTYNCSESNKLGKTGAPLLTLGLRLAVTALLPIIGTTHAGEPPADGENEAPEHPSSLTTLSILPFTVADQEKDQELGERMAEELEVPLSESGRFRILTRTTMTLEKMNDLIKLQAELGKTEERAAFQRLTCEEAFVCGSIRRDGEQGFVVYLYVISLASGEKIMALRSRCWHENAFRRLARAFTREIVDRVDINGAVVKALNDTFFVAIDGGPDGVQKGDFLAVRHVPPAIEGLPEEIDPGEQPPFTTLVVEAITATKHVRCVLKKEENEKPGEGDLVRLVPVCSAGERDTVAAVFPFTFTEAADEGAEKEQRAFAALVQQELLVANGKLRGQAIVNPPGSEKYVSGDADGRVVCDDLGVDAALKGDYALLGTELRVYLQLVLHPQVEVYREEQRIAAGVLRKRVVVTLQEDGKLTPQAATKVAEAITAAFPEEKDEKKKEKSE